MFDYKFRIWKDQGYPAGSALIIFLNQNRITEDLEPILKKYKLKTPAAVRTKLLNPEVKEIIYYTTDGQPDVVIVLKYITDKKFSTDFFRNQLTGITKYLYTEGILNVFLSYPDIKDIQTYFSNEEYLKQSCLEGIILGGYDFDKYKSENKKIKQITIFSEGEKKEASALSKKAEALKAGIYYARDLANEPSGVLTPDNFARRLRKDLQPFEVSTDIFDERKLLHERMNGIYSVGKGSVHPPRLIILHYKPKGRKKKICLVGKGVTFDSGGISIKPGLNMGEMKADMSGGAAAAGAIMAAAKLKLPIEIIGLIPAVENMPSGNSLKPGDIIIGRSGQSIEVIDTDAEGRIILSDALQYAKELKPDVIIDLATLTGSAVVALGEGTAALFSNNDELAQDLYNAGQSTFERVWRMPLWEEYDELIKSDVADMKNLGTKWGGNISAAKFLQRFTDENIPWAHLDIAGPAMPHDLTNYTKKYMTGFGVRLLIEYLIQMASMKK